MRLAEVQLRTKADKELALEALSSAIERELRILKAKLADVARANLAIKRLEDYLLISF